VPDWNEIVQANAAKVLNASLRVLGNLSDAEDVSQEVFAEAWQKWKHDPDRPWSGLLTRMSICRSIDSLRKRKATQSLAVEPVDDRISDPLQALVGVEIQSRLRKAMCVLSDRESEVFCLMYFEQQSHPEIAQTLGITKAAVATALSKARSKLEVAFREISTGEPR
jgi:RNA polymerase sigma-70 factor (ECF subfamily)